MQNSSNNNSRKIVLLALILALAGLGFAYTALSGNDDTDRTTINSKDSCGEPEIAPSKVGEADSDSEISSPETVVDVPHSVEKNNTPEKDNSPTEQPDSTNQADYRTTLPAKQLRTEYLGYKAIPETTHSAEYYGRAGGNSVNFSELTLREAKKNYSNWGSKKPHDLILTMQIAMPEVAKSYIGLQINRIEITTLVSKQSFIGKFEEGLTSVSTTIYLPLILNDDYDIRFHLTEQSGTPHVFSGLISTRGSARSWLLFGMFSGGRASVKLMELGIAETGKHRIFIKDSNGQPLKNVYLRSLYLEAESDDDGVIDIPSHFFEDDDVMYTDQRVLYIWAQGYVPQFLRISEVKKWKDGHVITLDEIILIKLDGLRKELLPDQNESGFYGSYSASESIDLYPFENSLKLEKFSDLKNRFFDFSDGGRYSCYPDLGFNTFNKGRWKWHDDNIGSSEAVKDKLFKGSQELWGHWYFRRWRPTQDGFSTILDIPAPGKYLLVIKEDLRGYPKELVIIDARDPANATWHKLIRP